jgi:two-component system cell cycle sensor histidine kinase/response regulator CckA
MARKILVIDDEPLILMTIEKALSKSGYEVTTTSDPGEFVSAVSTAGADMLIVDLHLGGIDTDALIEKAVGMAPKAKLLIVSGSVAEVKYENYLQKPFKISDLRSKVEELLA